MDRTTIENFVSFLTKDKESSLCLILKTLGSISNSLENNLVESTNLEVLGFILKSESCHDLFVGDITEINQIKDICMNIIGYRLSDPQTTGDGQFCNSELILALGVLESFMNHVIKVDQTKEYKVILEELLTLLRKPCLLEICKNQNVGPILPVLKLAVILFNKLDLSSSTSYEITIKDLLLEVFMLWNQNALIFIAVQIIPLLKFSICKSLWSIMASFYQQQELNQEENMTTLLILVCCFVERHYEVESREDEIPHSCALDPSREELFWIILQFAITSSNFTNRKRAVYILKWTLKHCQTSGSSFTVSSAHLDGKPVFFWDSENVKGCLKIWNEFILILEVLEEKQMHIIDPIFSKLDELFILARCPLNVSKFHHCWVLAIYRRMLDCDANTVVLWAIDSCLGMNLSDLCLDPHLLEDFIKFTTYDLVPALNNSSLYYKSKNTEAQKLNRGKLLGIFFNQIFSIPKSDNFSLQAVHDLINHFCVHPWGSSALFYLSHALTTIQSESILEASVLESLKELVQKALRTQETLLRGAIQCNILTLGLRLIDATKVTYDELSRFLVVFKKTECLQRGTAQWAFTSNWISDKLMDSNYDNISLDSAINYIKSSLEEFFRSESELHDATPDFYCSSKTTGLECTRISRMMVLIGDAYLKVTSYEAALMLSFTLMAEPTKILLEAHTRPYILDNKFDKAVSLVNGILAESQSPLCNELTSVMTQALLDLISPSMEDACNFLFQKAMNATNLENLKMYLDVLLALLTFKEIQPVSDRVSKIAFSEIKKNLQNEQITLVKTFCCWKGLYMCCSLSSENKILESKILAFMENNILNSSVLEWLTTEPKNICISPAQKSLASLALISAWQSIAWYLKRKKLDLVRALQLLDLSSSVLETASHEALEPVLEVIKLILPQACGTPQVENCLEFCWVNCMELKKNELFRPSLKAFIKCAFQYEIMEKHQVYLKARGQSLLDIGEKSNGVFILLIEHLVSLWIMNCQLELLTPYMFLLCDALTFGPIHQKDHQTVAEVANYINSQGKALSVNELVESDHLSASETRCLAISFLISLQEDNSEHSKIADLLAGMLIKKDNDISLSRSRHFGNSLTHRIKNRIWQALLLVQKILSRECNQNMVIFIYSSLAGNSQQPSVKYIQEWILARSIIFYPSLLPDFFDAMNIVSEKKMSSISSFLTVIVTVRNHITELNNTTLSKILQCILPWCMTTHFTTRLYAHVAFRKLMSKAKELKLECVLEKFGNIEDAIFVSDEHGNAKRNMKQILEEFIFDSFDPINHYCLSSIYYDFPRLTKLLKDEWISPRQLEEVIRRTLPKDFKELVNISYLGEGLDDLVPSEWTPKPTDLEFSLCHNDEEASNFNFQKKITPWRQVIPDVASIKELDAPILSSKTNKNSLVVVASLIDKTPNLGGLCRTCEVFGVSEYVVGNLNFTEDKIFRTLSVTAENWVPIKEVKPEYLKGYLSEMKSKGFLLIGVEQTINSSTLTSFNFPVKSLLLLGSEKEGIPVELIHLLDICVEIPQQGVIRSLNVHVSGAILIWEYAKQMNSK